MQVQHPIYRPEMSSAAANGKLHQLLRVNFVLGTFHPAENNRVIHVVSNFFRGAREVARA